MRFDSRRKLSAADRPALSSHLSLFPGNGWWWTIAAATTVDLIWLALSDRLSLAVGPFMLLATAALLSLLIGLRRASFKTWVRDAATGSAFILISFAALKILDYLLMSTRLPLADDLLDSWDRALGFDWPAYAEFIARHEWAAMVLRTAYLSLSQLTIVVFVVQFYFRGAERAAEYVRLFFACASIATIVGAFFPCIGVMVRYASPELAAAFGEGAGTYYLPPLEALRSDLPYQLDLRNMPGLVEFPSFHTASAVIMAYAFRDFGRISGLALLYALLLIASTPLMGGHYFVDLLAGTATAIGVMLVERASQRRKRRVIAAPMPDRQPAE